MATASARTTRTRVTWTAPIIVGVAAVLWSALAIVSGAGPGVGPEPLRVVKTFKHSGHVSTIVFSPDGKYLAAGGLLERAITIWDVQRGALVRTLVPDLGGVTALAWSSDGRWLASGRSLGRQSNRIAVTVWDPQTGRVLHRLPSPFDHSDRLNYVRWLASSPDGKQVAVALSGVAIYETVTGALLRTLTGHPALGAVVDYSPDGKYLATSGEPERAPIEVFDARTGAHVRSLVARVGSQPRLVFSPDGRFIASSGHETPAIEIWDVEAGRPSRPPLWGHAGPVRALGYSPDGKWLASASPGDAIKLWAPSHGVMVVSQALGQRAGSTLGFSPDGKHLASSDGEVVKLWDFRSALPSLMKRLNEKGQ